MMACYTAILYWYPKVQHKPYHWTYL